MKNSNKDFAKTVGLLLMITGATIFGNKIFEKKSNDKENKQKLENFIASLPNYADSLSIAEQEYTAEYNKWVEEYSEDDSSLIDLYKKHGDETGKYIWSLLSKQDQEKYYNRALDIGQKLNEGYPADDLLLRYDKLKLYPEYTIQYLAFIRDTAEYAQMYHNDELLAAKLAKNPNKKIKNFSDSRSKLKKNMAKLDSAHIKAASTRDKNRERFMKEQKNIDSQVQAFKKSLEK